MRILRLELEGLRCVQRARLTPGPGVQFLCGPNGAGKTTVLEGMHLLGYGRSFRGGLRDATVARGSAHSLVFAELERERGGLQRVGLRRAAGTWSARVDERDVEGLAELFLACPVVCFEPGSHELIAGGSESRRAFLDWTVFHVEPGFLPAWRRLQRALRQRNAGLRAGWSDALLAPWEEELADASLIVAEARNTALEELRSAVMAKAQAFLPELGAVGLVLGSGFGERATTTREEILAAYCEGRDQDRERGFTRFGAHRADWQLSFAEAPRREYLSRGQEKLAALVMELAQVEHFRERSGEWPILLLDDLGAELDAEHLDRVLEWVFGAGLQAWITGTAVPPVLRDRPRDWHLFHVEQGAVSAA